MLWLSDAWASDTLQYGLIACLLTICTAAFVKHFRIWHSITRDKQVAQRKIQLLLVVTAVLLTSLNLQLWYQFAGSFQASRPLTYDVLSMPLKPFQVSGFSFAEANSPKEISDFQCDSVMFNDTLLVTNSTQFHGQLKRIRDQLALMAQEEYPIARNCFLDKEGESEDSILQKNWFHFCGSSVWLEKYQVHFMVSRVLYTHRGTRNRPTINMIYMQVFDRNWKEQFDVTLDSDQVFPSVLKVDIDQSPNTPKRKNSLMGPEDPRVAVREYYKDGVLHQEPVVVFNMRTKKLQWARAMHVSRPLSGAKTVLLRLNNRKPAYIEKNWAPFFDPEEPKLAYFVYNFNPFRIVGCDINSGRCDKLSGPDFDLKSSKVGKLRGGTNMVPVPASALPTSLRLRKYWFGIARSHSADCGCVKELYRPHLYIVSTGKDGDYSMDYVSSLVDFNVRPEGWDPRKSVCDDGKSVLIPNSVSYWDFEEDLMGIIYSEADRTNKLLHVKGILSHVLRVLNKGRAVDSTERDKEVELLGSCALSRSSQYCAAAAKAQNWFEKPPKTLSESEDFL